MTQTTTSNNSNNSRRNITTQTSQMNISTDTINDTNEQGNSFHLVQTNWGERERDVAVRSCQHCLVLQMRTRNFAKQVSLDWAAMMLFLKPFIRSLFDENVKGEKFCKFGLTLSEFEAIFYFQGLKTQNGT